MIPNPKCTNQNPGLLIPPPPEVPVTFPTLLLRCVCSFPFEIIRTLNKWFSISLTVLHHLRAFWSRMVHIHGRGLIILYFLVMPWHLGSRSALYDVHTLMKSPVDPFSTYLTNPCHEAINFNILKDVNNPKPILLSFRIQIHSIFLSSNSIYFLELLCKEITMFPPPKK